MTRTVESRDWQRLVIAVGLVVVMIVGLSALATLASGSTGVQDVSAGDSTHETDVIGDGDTVVAWASGERTDADNVVTASTLADSDDQNLIGGEISDTQLHPIADAGDVEFTITYIGGTGDEADDQVLVDSVPVSEFDADLSDRSDVDDTVGDAGFVDRGDGDVDEYFINLPNSGDDTQFEIIAHLDGFESFTGTTQPLGPGESDTQNILLEQVDETGQITGDVITEDDENIPGAEVTLYEETGDGPVQIDSAITGEEGSYAFAGVPTGNDYMLEATYDGKIGTNTIEDLFEGTNTADIVISDEIEIDYEYRMDAFVVDDDGEQVKFEQVERGDDRQVVVEVEQRPLDQTGDWEAVGDGVEVDLALTTDSVAESPASVNVGDLADGTLTTFDGTVETTFTAAEAQSGFANVTASAENDDGSVTETEAGQQAQVEVFGPATITGDVVNEDGENLPGATVTLYDGDDTLLENPLTVAQADSLGSFTITEADGEALRSGESYIVQAEFDGETETRTFENLTIGTNDGDIAIVGIGESPQLSAERHAPDSVVPGETAEVTVTTQADADLQNFVVSEDFAPAVEDSSVEAVTVGGEATLPAAQTADGDGVDVVLDDDGDVVAEEGDVISVTYEMELPEAEDEYEISGDVTGTDMDEEQDSVDLGTDTVVAAEASIDEYREEPGEEGVELDGFRRGIDDFSDGEIELELFRQIIGEFTG